MSLLPFDYKGKQKLGPYPVVTWFQQTKYPLNCSLLAFGKLWRGMFVSIFLARLEAGIQSQISFAYPFLGWRGLSWTDDDSTWTFQSPSYSNKASQFSHNNLVLHFNCLEIKWTASI